MGRDKIIIILISVFLIIEGYIFLSQIYNGSNKYLQKDIEQNFVINNLSETNFILDSQNLDINLIILVLQIILATVNVIQ